MASSGVAGWALERAALGATLAPMAALTSVSTLRTADVARVLGLPEARVRAFVRAGWCAPERRGRALAFGFQDLVVLRAAKALHEARIPAARVERALLALARELGEVGGLSGLRIAADGTRVVVHRDGASFEPESGRCCSTSRWTRSRAKLACASPARANPPA